MQNTSSVVAPIQSIEGGECPVEKRRSDLTDNEIADFLEWVSVFGTPEDFDGIQKGPFRKDEPFRIRAKFRADPLKREDRRRAYCPMCRSHNKYIEGRLVYFYEIGEVGAIGIECADDSTSSAADKAFKYEKDLRSHEDYLLDILGRVDRFIDCAKRLRLNAELAQNVHHALRRQAPELVAGLRSIQRNGGQLRVSEELDGEIAQFGPSGFRGSTTNTRDRSFGHLAGGIAVKQTFDPVRLVDSAIRRLSVYMGAADEDQVLDRVCKLGEELRLSWAASEIKAAVKDYNAARSQVAEFWKFFDPANIGRITDWAIHPSHAIGHTVMSGTTSKGRSLRISSRRGALCYLQFDTVVASILPELPLG